MRARRRTLDHDERRLASLRVTEAIVASRLFRQSRHIALYLANDGELDLDPLVELALHRGKRLYLPVLSPQRTNHLLFAPYHHHSLLLENRFGIPEPLVSPRQLVAPRRLDLVLTPLVAFDTQGNRLGMGGGFYDRSFAFLHHRRSWRKPQLLGVAYEFQQLPQLPHQEWDVPLSGIATETGITLFD